MAMVRKGSSAKTIAANRANGQKSAGVPTATRSAGRLQHGLLAKVDPLVMGELGEDPAEYAQLSQAWIKSLAPQDPTEHALCEQMINALWRQRRLYRGEAAAQAEQRRTLKLERQHRLASEFKHAGAAIQNKLAAQAGMVGLSDSQFKFDWALLLLREVAAAADLGQFTAELLEGLQMLYGSQPSMVAGPMIGFYEDCVRASAEGKAVDEAVTEEVRRNLKAEIACFQTLQGLYRAMHVDIPPSLLDSRLLLSNKDSRRLNRYETTIARQFYGALDRFMEYRRFRLAYGGTMVDTSADADGRDPSADISSRGTGGPPQLPGPPSRSVGSKGRGRGACPHHVHC